MTAATSEPIVLPGAFPNLLANGSSGIAVGMATNIPPHNAAELCDAALHLIKNAERADRDAGRLRARARTCRPAASSSRTRASIIEAYRTGRGSFRVRARWEVEDQGRGTYVVVVTEIPYQVQKSRLIEKIAELLEAKKLPLVADVRDKSAEDIRIVIEPQSRTVDPALMMESLFRLTDLETRVPLNMNVLSQGRRAEGDGPRRGAQRVAGAPPRGAACGAPKFRLERDPPPPRSARRLPRSPTSTSTR